MIINLFKLNNMKANIYTFAFQFSSQEQTLLKEDKISIK